MDEKNNPDTRSLDQRVSHVERVVDSLRADFTTVKSDVATIAGQIGPLAQALVRVEGRLNQPQTPTPWPAIIGAVCTVLVLLGAIGFSNLQPVASVTTANANRIFEQSVNQAVSARDADRNYAWLSGIEGKLDATSEGLAELRGKTGIYEERLRSLEDFEREAAFIHGQREGLEEQVQGIDRYGSRRWNAERP